MPTAGENATTSSGSSHGPSSPTVHPSPTAPTTASDPTASSASQNVLAGATGLLAGASDVGTGPRTTARSGATSVSGWAVAHRSK